MSECHKVLRIFSSTAKPKECNSTTTHCCPVLASSIDRHSSTCSLRSKW